MPKPVFRFIAVGVAIPVALIAAMALAQAPGAAQLPTPDIKVDVPLVNLSVRVTGKGGHPVATLGRQQFRIFEDGIEQTVSHFQPVTAPTYMLLLLDLSGSTYAKMDVIVEAAARFVDAVGPEDKIAVADFARGLHVVSEFTGDRTLLKKRIRSLENRGTRTGFYDAMWAALDLMAGTQAPRKAIVVMTDGFDNSLVDAREWAPRHPFEELLARAAGSDCVIYSVYLHTENDFQLPHLKKIHAAYARAFRQVDELARQTGGMMFRSRRAENLEETYRRVAEELRMTYSLAYAPINPIRNGAWRKISVEVNHPGAQVRTRPGYYAK